MRTALFLLLLLAIAAVPGSIFPQRSIDPARVADYIADHPTAGPWLDRLGFFEVYASPWFRRSTCCSSSRSSAASLPRTGSLAPLRRPHRAPRAASSASPPTAT